MSLAYASYAGNVLGRNNAAAATAYYAVVPGKDGGYTRVGVFSMTSGNTANDGVWMRPIGRANVATAFTANTGASIVLDADPSPSGNTISAGDQVVVKGDDGTYSRYQVNTAGWNSTSKTVTFTGNVLVNLSVGAKVWNFGVNSDTDPATGVAHPAFPSTANATKTYTFGPAGIKGHKTGDPLLFYCANATAATNLDYTEYGYTVA